jgi:hypothetical protein
MFVNHGKRIVTRHLPRVTKRSRNHGFTAANFDVERCTAPFFIETTIHFQLASGRGHPQCLTHTDHGRGAIF